MRSHIVWSCDLCFARWDSKNSIALNTTHFLPHFPGKRTAIICTTVGKSMLAKTARLIKRIQSWGLCVESSKWTFRARCFSRLGEEAVRSWKKCFAFGGIHNGHVERLSNIRQLDAVWQLLRAQRDGTVTQLPHRKPGRPATRWDDLKGFAAHHLDNDDWHECVTFSPERRALQTHCVLLYSVLLLANYHYHKHDSFQ